MAAQEVHFAGYTGFLRRKEEQQLKVFQGVKGRPRYMSAPPQSRGIGGSSNYCLGTASCTNNAPCKDSRCVSLSLLEERSKAGSKFISVVGSHSAFGSSFWRFPKSEEYLSACSGTSRSIDSLSLQLEGCSPDRLVSSYTNAAHGVFPPRGKAEDLRQVSAPGGLDITALAGVSREIRLFSLTCHSLPYWSPALRALLPVCAVSHLQGQLAQRGDVSQHVQLAASHQLVQNMKTGVIRTADTVLGSALRRTSTSPSGSERFYSFPSSTVESENGTSMHTLPAETSAVLSYSLADGTVEENDIASKNVAQRRRSWVLSSRARLHRRSLTETKSAGCFPFLLGLKDDTTDDTTEQWDRRVKIELHVSNQEDKSRETPSPPNEPQATPPFEATTMETASNRHHVGDITSSRNSSCRRRNCGDSKSSCRSSCSCNSTPCCSQQPSLGQALECPKELESYFSSVSKTSQMLSTLFSCGPTEVEIDNIQAAVDSSVDQQSPCETRGPKESSLSEPLPDLSLVIFQEPRWKDSGSCNRRTSHAEAVACPKAQQTLHSGIPNTLQTPNISTPAARNGDSDNSQDAGEISTEEQIASDVVKPQGLSLSEPSPSVLSACQQHCGLQGRRLLSHVNLECMKTHALRHYSLSEMPQMASNCAHPASFEVGSNSLQNAANNSSKEQNHQAVGPENASPSGTPTLPFWGMPVEPQQQDFHYSGRQASHADDRQSSLSKTLHMPSVGVCRVHAEADSDSANAVESSAKSTSAAEAVEPRTLSVEPLTVPHFRALAMSQPRDWRGSSSLPKLQQSLSMPQQQQMQGSRGYSREVVSHEQLHGKSHISDMSDTAQVGGEPGRTSNSEINGGGNYGQRSHATDRGESGNGERAGSPHGCCDNGRNSKGNCSSDSSDSASSSSASASILSRNSSHYGLLSSCREFGCSIGNAVGCSSGQTEGGKGRHASPTCLSGACAETPPACVVSQARRDSPYGEDESQLETSLVGTRYAHKHSAASSSLRTESASQQILILMGSCYTCVHHKDNS